MKTINKLRFLLIGTVFLVLIYVYLTTNHEKLVMDELQIFAYLDDKEIPLSLWKDKSDGNYYLFLPSAFSAADKQEILFRVEYGDLLYKVDIDGVTYKSGEKWKDNKEEDEHCIAIKDFWGVEKEKYTFQVLCSENLPAMMITADNIWEIENPQLMSEQKYVEMGTIQMWDPDGALVLDGKMENFKMRGNYTRIMDKKPFTFTLTEPVSLCGMEEAVKWNLLANATDGSYLRNKMTLDMAAAGTEDYVPGAEYVDLFINGEYRGMYLLTEVAEAGENRLNIEPNNSWLMELDLDVRGVDQAFSFATKQGQTVALHTEYEPMPEEQEQIKKLINGAEQEIYNFQNPIAKLNSVIDMDSWAFVWTLQEISGNCDVGITSQFFYTKEKREDAVLYAGPVWDFDATMGNTYVAMFRVPNALTSAVEQTRAEYSVNQNRWMSALYKHEEFREAVAREYEDIFLPLIDHMLSEGMDEYTDFIARSAELDALRWHNERLNWQYVLPENLVIPEEGDYHRFNTIAANVDMVRSFLEEKRAFLYDLWILEEEFDILEEENTQIVLDSNDVIYKWVKKNE